MREVTHDLCKRVEEGDSFSAALARHPKTFSRLYVSMVEGGERGGLLAEILGRLSGYLESTARLRRKIKSAVMYPMVVALVAILICVFLLVYVVPIFGEVFKGFGARLPAPTQFLISLSGVVKRYAPVLLLGGGGLVYVLLYFIKSPFGRHYWDSYRIRMPIFGDLAHKICLARFSRNFASLIRSGVPILEVLQIVSQTVGNVVMEKAVKAAALDIEQGQSISTALAKHAIFPEMTIRMVACGEQTGDVDNMLERIADFLDEEVEITLGGLLLLIEPFLILFLGVVVGGMVICMFLPIFKLPEIVNSMR